MRQQDFYLCDPVKCHYCKRCIQHTREQHEDHTSRYCDIHHRWCGNHQMEEDYDEIQPIAKAS